MATIDRGDHDDVDDDDSKGGDVDDLNGDCSAWRLSVPYGTTSSSHRRLFISVASRRRSLLSIRQSNDPLQRGQSP